MDNPFYEYCNSSMHVPRDPLSDFLDSCGLTVKQFGYQLEMPYIGPRIYGDLELIYLLSGDGILNINGKIYHGKANDMFVLPKYSLCSFTNPGDRFENYFIHIDISDPIAAEQFKSIFREPLLHLDADPVLTQCYRWLEDFYRTGGSGSHMAINSLLRLILVRVFCLSGVADSKHTMYQKHKMKNSQYQLLRKSIEIITEKQGDITVTELCNILYVSPTYIRRIFRSLLGKSLLTFIRSVRIRAAEIMLITTAKPISDIAVQLGFSSPYHLSNEFKKYHSISPSTYRKLMNS